MKIVPLFLLTSLLSLEACFFTTDKQSREAEMPPANLKLKQVTKDVARPIAMVPLPGGGFLICQQEGKIWLWKDGRVNTAPVLDLTSRVIKINEGYDERGLLGIALSPQFKQNRKFYVYYSAPTSVSGMNNKTILAEYQMANAASTKADIGSERILLETQEPQFNHEGGCLQFGPDGYLYIGLGDGGGGGDKHGTIGNGQNLGVLLGKMLRIDVNGNPYTVPKDNPFVNTKGARPEIWAYGLRNPWRFSFDSGTGELFCGDVGQDTYEEVDIIRKGGNYGWRVMEGFHVYNMPAGGADTARMIKPIAEYTHGKTGISIIGGYVYRGSRIPSLEGKYLFGDFNGNTFYLQKDRNGSWNRFPLNFSNKPKGFHLYSYAEDKEGELYLLGEADDHGVIYKISL